MGIFDNILKFGYVSLFAVYYVYNQRIMDETIYELKNSLKKREKDSSESESMERQKT